MNTESARVEMPRILIIIVTWNKKDYVLDLLDSLDTLNYQRAALDVMVIDNASNDGTAEALRQNYPQVNLIVNPENIGGTGGFNTGLAWAFEQPQDRYKYLWLLDNDVLVHQDALQNLVTLLEQKPDIAVAGSTMMQLDYPWRINEMGAYLNRDNGHLILNRHLEEIIAWKGKTVHDLLQTPADLNQHLMLCQPYMDIDYVAAASLLIRSDVARQTGLWRDYFIHFDDVEWCLRIREQGHRIVVSACSLIWHLSAAAKVPTWVLYYDNRNILDLLKTHGASDAVLQSNKTYIYKKAIYYDLIGKSDLARLHKDAIEDFEQDRLGKKNIQLDYPYLPNAQFNQVLHDPKVKRILLPWTLNLQEKGVQETIVQACLQRPELTVECLVLTGSKVYLLPNPSFTFLPLSRIKRLWRYWQLRQQGYDLVLQSDYHILPALSWLGKEVVFINAETFSRRPQPQWKAIWQGYGWRWLWSEIKSRWRK